MVMDYFCAGRKPRGRRPATECTKSIRGLVLSESSELIAEKPNLLHAQKQKAPTFRKGSQG